MLIKYSIKLCAVMLISINTYAQSVTAIAEQSVNPAGVIDEFPLPAPTLQGSLYLNDDWKQGRLVLKNGDELNDVMLNYDLQNSLLEIKSKRAIKVCPPMLLEKFEIKDGFGSSKNFENLANYDKNKIGILEIKYNKGNYTYAVNPYIFIREPSYVPTMDVGNRNKKVLKKMKYYFIKNDKLIPFKRSKKSILNLASNNSDKVESYMKSNKINLKDDNALAGVMKFYIDLLN